MMTKNAIVTYSVLVLLLLLGLVGGFECNNLKKFRCKRGGKARVNGCTWAKDAFKKYRHFPISKKKLFGICLNAGQSESQVFGTPAEQCDCGTKCKRKCTTKRGYKKKCYWASRDGNPRSSAGTCLPNRHFLPGCAGQFNDQSFDTALDLYISEYLDDNLNTSVALYGNISDWDTKCVTNMGLLGQPVTVGRIAATAQTLATTFNEDLSKWDTSSVTSMANLFGNLMAFNSDLSKWDVSKLETMENMFGNAQVFNSDLSKWNTSKVESMSSAFFVAWQFEGNSLVDVNGTYVNVSLADWDVSKVTNMNKMFGQCKALKSDLSKWDVSKVTDFTHMLSSGPVPIDTDLSKWDTSAATNMRWMFKGAENFNSDLSKWDVSKVIKMDNLFREVPLFESNLTQWDVSSVVDKDNMFKDADAFDCLLIPTAWQGSPGSIACNN